LKINKFPENSLIPLFEEGLITLQDLSSYQVTQAVQAKPDEIGLDACSGHGGKSSAIAEQMGVGSQDFIPLYVHDISSTHLADLEQNFRRLGLWSPKILENSQQAKDEGLSFDWILVDAPCSGMGTLGRKPEIRWRMKENFFKRYQDNQLKILSEWVPFLKPQGRLIYAVCSLEPEEGRDVVNGLLREYPDLCEDFSKQNLPFESPQDGFFVSKIVKK
jgi:16S rRNA (cytosine967-C5)-methyltransferase